jgi:hypothetical protein
VFPFPAAAHRQAAAYKDSALHSQRTAPVVPLYVVQCMQCTCGACMPCQSSLTMHMQVADNTCITSEGRRRGM